MKALLTLKKSTICFIILIVTFVDSGLAQNWPFREKNSDANNVDLTPLVQPIVNLFHAYSVDSSATKIPQNDTTIINKSNVTEITTSAPSVVQNSVQFDTEALIRRIFGITTTTTTITPRPSDLLVQTIFEPIIDSIHNEIRKAKTMSQKSIFTRDGTKTLIKEPNLLYNFDYDQYTTANGDDNFPRRAPTKMSLKNSELMRKMMGDSIVKEPFELHDEKIISLMDDKSTLQRMQVRKAEEPSPLATLLRFVGVDSRPKTSEVQVGRDYSVSVLGMPVGRRDGLALSPLTGVSLGNQDMYGPIAVNDRYNVKWDFLDHIRDLFQR